MTELEDRLMWLWEQQKSTGTWNIFGGVFTVDNQRWQVVPMGKTWVDGNFVDQKPKFLKCS